MSGIRGMVIEALERGGGRSPVLRPRLPAVGRTTLEAASGAVVGVADMPLLLRKWRERRSIDLKVPRE